MLDVPWGAMMSKVMKVMPIVRLPSKWKAPGLWCQSRVLILAVAPLPRPCDPGFYISRYQQF